VILCIGVLAVLLSRGYLKATGIDSGEYYTLLPLLARSACSGLVSCRELVSLFVALEVMSVALYALCGLHRSRAESQEASLKYFITGAFSSGFFLYGIALLYGASGSTSLPLVAQGPALGRRVHDPAGGPRHRPAAGRLRLQGRERALPHVGAGRLRGRTHDGDGADVRRREGRRVRARCCASRCRRCPRWPTAGSRPWRRWPSSRW
jgi:hypothetical protein